MVMCKNNHATHLTTQEHAGSGVAPEGRSRGRISAIARLGIRNKYEWHVHVGVQHMYAREQ